MSIIRNKIKTVGALLLFVFCTGTVSAQDLLARQAPIDRRAKKLDSIEVKTLVERENIQSPAAQLYGDEWDNTYAHRATELPDSFKINLRHFCMPTPSRVVTSNFGLVGVASTRDWTLKYISATPFVRLSLAKYVSYAMKPEVMATISSSVIPMALRRSMVTFPSNSLPKTKPFERENPLV